MSAPEYQRQDGTLTTADDPERLIWYGVCRYWTDDWTKVTVRGPGIPCCPGCGRPGFMVDAATWFAGIETYEADGHPGYAKELEGLRESCPTPRSA